MDSSTIESTASSKVVQTSEMENISEIIDPVIINPMISSNFQLKKSEKQEENTPTFGGPGKDIIKIASTGNFAAPPFVYPDEVNKILGDSSGCYILNGRGNVINSKVDLVMLGSFGIDDQLEEQEPKFIVGTGSREKKQNALTITTTGTSYTMDLKPRETQKFNLGSTKLEFLDCYLSNAPIINSDQTKRTSVDSAPGLSYINLLDPVSFKHENGMTYYGFGKELPKFEQSQPIVVQTNDYVGLKTIDLIPCLVQAIKDLSARIG